MGFAKIYPSESPRVQAVKREVGSYKPGTRTLATPRIFSRSEGGQLRREPQKKIGLYTPPQGWGGYERVQAATRAAEQKRSAAEQKRSAGVRPTRARQPKAKSPNTKMFRKKQPSTLDDLLGCDELGCMLDDCSLEDALEELDGIGDDLLKFGKKIVGGVANAFDALNKNPVFQAVFPVIALANSDVGLKIGSSIPGVGNVVALGTQVKDWAKSSNISLPPNVALWAGQAANGVTKEIPPEVTAWAKAAIPSEAVAAAKAAGVDISALKTAPSKGISLGKMLGEATAKGNKIFGAFQDALALGVANAKAAGPTPTPTPTPAVDPQVSLALAAPVPMNVPVPTSQPAASVNYTVSPLSGQMAAIAAQFEAKIGADLARIQAQVKLRSLQDQATSEHKALMKQARFERSLVSGLRQIAANTRRS